MKPLDENPTVEEKDTNLRAFGEYLRSLREQSKLTMCKLSRLSGVSQGYISQIESGARGMPSISILIKIAKVLGVPASELINTRAGYMVSDLLHTSECLDDSILIQLRVMNRNIITYLKNEPGISYKGQIISEKDRERIVKIIDALLSED